MATIPRGDFGHVIAQPQRAIGAPDLSAPARALGQLGQTVAGIVTDQMAADTARGVKEYEDAKSNEAMDAALSYEIGAKSRARDIARRVQTGELKPEEAQREWEDQRADVRSTTVGKLQASRYSEGAMRHAKQTDAAGDELVLGSIDAFRRQENGAAADRTLDQIGKVALLPGESVEKGIARADDIYPQLAQRAGIPQAQWSRTLQSWKDSLRYDRAKLELVDARRDPQALEQFAARLGEDGDLRGKLDPDKVVALTKEAESYRWQMQQSVQHAADKREKAAERDVREAERQIEQGVPLSLERWDTLRSKTAGTESAPDFNRLVKQERETQQILRLPIDQQQAYVQQREAQLMQNGGTLADRGNLQRIRATVEYNTKQLQDDPLVAAQRLYGRAVKPIDWADIATPLGPERAAEAFNDRAATLAAMRKQFGPSVGLKPLMPQEVRLLTKVLDDASPQTAVSLFGSLRWAIGSDDVYQAAMGQIAQDSPVKAHAGLFAAVNVPITLDRNRLSADVRTSSVKVAQTMLMGEGIINRTKAQKSQDGKDASLAAPARSAFDADFADHVGNLYRGRPEAQQIDLQAAFAYYVGRAAEKGRLATSPQDIDSKLVRESIAAAIGDVVNVNGFGEAKAPIGMSGDKFEKKAEQAFIEEIRARGLPPEWAEHWSGFGLMNWRQDGTYLLTVGGNPVTDPKTREPIVLDLVWRGATGRKFGRQPWEHPPAYIGPPIPEGTR